MLRIYVAGPYGRKNGLSDEECEKNVQKAIEVARLLVRRGHIPFLPHLYHYLHVDWENTLEEDEWWQMSATWIPFCEALFRIEGYSSGSDGEVEVAQSLGKSIFYSMDDVPDESSRL